MERSTRQRSSIRAVMEAAGRPLLPAEILGAAQREVPAIGLATVYRNIKQLAEAGEVQSVELPGEPTRYELSGHAHHHHFRCTQCNRVFDVHGCPGDMQQIVPPGFKVMRHELTLYGTCGDCQGLAQEQAAEKAASL
jgi:Fur family ferric uptake transcriptional regulator